jgi:Cft2 family RNA processing exonuclease
VTGDVSYEDQVTVPGIAVPESARRADLLLIESTYCQPRTRSRRASVEDFLTAVAQTVSRGGRVLVPAFALGRAQEVAALLARRLPEVPVLLDGMAADIAELYERITDAEGSPVPIFGDTVRRVGRDRDYLLSDFRTGVVVTTSGMLHAGPAVVWARHILPEPNAALLLCGYQDAESPGRALLDLVDGGGRNARRVFTPPDRPDRPVPVAAQVAAFALSAHADREGLRRVVDAVSPAHVMLVHGRRASQVGFREHLRVVGHTPVPTADWSAGRRG